MTEKKIRLTIAAAVLCFGLLAFVEMLFYKPTPELRIPVVAPVFVPAAGCASEDITPYSWIPKNCLLGKYQIIRPKRYGLMGNYSGFNWYRYYNTAIFASCNELDTECHVHQTVPGFFKQP